MKAPDFDGLRECLAVEVDQMGVPYRCHILENNGIYNEKNVLNLCVAHGRNYNHIRPYSAMSNPIEDCIGDVKHRIQTLFATTLRPHRLNLAELPCKQKTQERDQLLLQALDVALSVASPQCLPGHQNQMFGPLPAILNQQDM
jgi:hypothetical protein